MNPNIQNSTPTPSPNQPFRIAKDTLFFSIIAIGIYICALKYILFPKVEFSDIWVATTLLLLGMLVSLIGLIDNWGSATTNIKRNITRILCVLAVLFFGFSTYSEFDKAHDSKKLTSTINYVKDNSDTIKVTGNISNQYAKENKDNYLDTINPKLRETLAMLDSVKRINKINLEIGAEDLAQNIKNKLLTDSLNEAKEIQGLADFLDYFTTPSTVEAVAIITNSIANPIL
ncbi:MAG: hypothetical protein DI535_19990 [Citrobacter freundii]|nr:MAG: hypothetical protein DI535_19990 [Citrobacter freundii]